MSKLRRGVVIAIIVIAALRATFVYGPKNIDNGKGKSVLEFFGEPVNKGLVDNLELLHVVYFGKTKILDISRLSDHQLLAHAQRKWTMSKEKAGPFLFDLRRILLSQKRTLPSRYRYDSNGILLVFSVDGTFTRIPVKRFIDLEESMPFYFIETNPGSGSGIDVRCAMLDEFFIN